MYYVKTIGTRNEKFDYRTFETKAEAEKYLMNKGYARDVINTGKPIQKPPDTFWNGMLQRSATIFSD